MARLARIVIPGVAHHVTQRGNCRLPVFFSDDDSTRYLGLLKDGCEKADVRCLAWCLMDNHVHLVLVPTDADGLGRMMQWIGRQYVPYFNAKYRRTGTLWQGRYRATVIESAQYFLPCCRYIESEPVRSGLAADPEQYRWSSYVHHAGVQPDPLITDHALYWALGNTPFDREAVYKSLMEQGLSTSEVNLFRTAARKGWPLGSEKFKAELEKQINRRVAPAKRGRPVKPRAPYTSPDS